MDPPNKRLKQSPPPDENFVPLGGDDEAYNEPYGYSAANNNLSSQPEHGNSISHGPRAPRDHPHRRNNAWNDPRNAKDRPKSKHALPGHEPWILVKTKYNRRFVHNTVTKESLWYVPDDVMPGVHEFERWEVQQREKEDNARWAEEQLKEMREKSKVGGLVEKEEVEGGRRRRRSESLQREDEEAMMAELATQAERQQERDAEEAVKSVQALQPQAQQQQQDANGYDSESSYEEVEVTDSEFEGDETQAKAQSLHDRDNAVPPPDEERDAAVEFGEDDIAYQLAAMGQDYGLDPGEYGDGEGEEEWEEGAEGLPLTEEEAANLFRSMLDDHRVSPFTPWEKLIQDDSETSVLMDDRYTVLSSMRERKEVWEGWVKDTAAKLKDERANMEKSDPRIPYLAFLQEKASPKLYWPEFKRKYKKDFVMNDRKLSDKERGKLYREHVNRLKLPESTRKADFLVLLKSIPPRSLNKDPRLGSLPQEVLSHLHYISLPPSTRDRIVSSHIASLPPLVSQGADPDGEVDHGELKAEEAKRRKLEAALEAREREVGEAKRKAEKEERWARKGLEEEERELRRAMQVNGRAGLLAQLGGDGV